MPQNITKSAMSMVEAAKREIEEIEAAEAVKLAGRDDVVLVDIRDVRERARDGKVPGAFHAPRGLLEFWIDPASPSFNTANASKDRKSTKTIRSKPQPIEKENRSNTRAERLKTSRNTQITNITTAN